MEAVEAAEEVEVKVVVVVPVVLVLAAVLGEALVAVLEHQLQA